MKWLFIVAALLNIVFFSYASFFADKNDSQREATKQIGKKQLVLLSELNAIELKKLQNTVISTPEKSTDHQLEEISSNINTMESENKEMIKVPDSEPLVVSNQQVCYKLGPFAKKELDGIKLILEKEYQNDLSFGIETTSAITYYRIYIPPVESKEVRNKTLKKLDQHGMKDHYVMSIDGRKNAIALGVFKKRSAAETIATKASKIGLSTTIEAISDDKDSLYKLQLIFQEDSELSTYNKFISQRKLKSSECEK